MPKIRVIVADDERLLRDALQAILSLHEDLEVVAVAADGAEAVAQIARFTPDVAVLDLQMPTLDGIAVTEQSAKDSPGTRCMILTSHARPGYLKRALAAGARSFIPKTTSADDLAAIIRRVHDGQRYVDPELSAEAIAAGDSPLTAREADILEMASQGTPIDEIAARAHLSKGTVRNYLSSAAIKLDAPNRHVAAEIARTKGWI
ncbi:MAG: response regulator transcription factor [Ancrocorticia sp.]|uniref:response regulator transcription factor n=1 Tax=Ancrocorticia sp. TaxID=2593684 RepID=UPI003F92188C